MIATAPRKITIRVGIPLDPDDPSTFPLEPSEHVWLAHKFAKKYEERFGLEYGEMWGEAYMALYNACRTFNPKLNIRPSTHLVKAIQWQLPMRHRRSKGQIRTHTIAEPQEHWAGLKTQAIPYLDGQEMLAAKVEAEPTLLPDSVVNALMRLKPIQADIVIRRVSGETMQDIATGMGVSRERVRQIWEQAISMIRWRVARPNGIMGESGAVDAIELLASQMVECAPDEDPASC